jgi:hypothetical protein
MPKRLQPGSDQAGYARSVIGAINARVQALSEGLPCMIPILD